MIHFVWRLVGKGRVYRRHKRNDVGKTLAENGFEILEIQRSSVTSNSTVACLNCMLWTPFRASNALAIVARKNHLGAT